MPAMANRRYRFCSRSSDVRGVPWRMSPAVLMPLDSEERLRVVSRHADFMSSGFMSFVFRWWELESVRIQSVTIVWGEEPCPKMLREGM